MYEYPFTSNYFRAKAGRIHYLDEGEGPVVTMVHGNPTWSYYFRNLVKELSGRFRVIVPDHLGCGLSDKPQRYQYTLENHIGNLTALLDSLGISSTSLVLHDWGGAIGMGFGTAFPDRLDKVVVMNTAAFRSTRIPLRIGICRIPLFGEILVRACNLFAWPATFMAVGSVGFRRI